MTDDLDDPFWKDGGRPDEELIDEWKDIPTCFVSGWYANHLTANFDKFRALSTRFESPVELVEGHWEHRMTPTFAGVVEFGAESDIDVFGVHRVRWFDRTLKGIDADVEVPAVRYFLMGGGKGTRNADGRLVHGGRWAGSQTWPPAAASTVAYHLHGDGVLRERAPEVTESSTTFTFDPRDPVPTVGGAFMEYSRHDFFGRVTWMADGGAQDQRGNPSKPFCRDALTLAQRDDVLVFQTEPLDDDVVIAGEIVARLWVSTDALDIDFTVKLMDVHPPTAGFPEGFAMNLQDAVVRMRYRNGRRKPDLIEPGEVYEIELPLHSTANRFLAGHRIRVDVSSSNFPRIDVNLNNGGPLGVPGPVRTAENTVFHDATRPSHIELPVLRG